MIKYIFWYLKVRLMYLEYTLDYRVNRVGEPMPWSVYKKRWNL